MSNELKDFLTAWLMWAMNGAPEGCGFDRRNGLCSCVITWNIFKGPPYSNANAMQGELTDMFRDMFSDPDFEAVGDSWSVYPFGGSGVFDFEYDKGTAHTNQARIQWVRNQLNQGIK